METGEFFATFGGGVFILIVIVFCVIARISKSKAQNDKQREQQEAKQYGQRSSSTSSSLDEQKLRQEVLKQRLQQKYGQTDADVQAAKHAKHVEDSHAHGHLGEEEHYEEIVGSLGEINDEGCEDLSGVRFIATDLAYELQDSATIDYDRLAQAMVLGEIINSPRYKKPYSRRKY